MRDRRIHELLDKIDELEDRYSNLIKAIKEDVLNFNHESIEDVKWDLESILKEYEEK